MSPIGSNSVAAQTYSGIQRSAGNAGDAGRIVSPGVREPVALAQQGGGNALPRNATPRGDWVLSENANPQSFDAGSPRGTYLNVVV